MRYKLPLVQFSEPQAVWLLLTIMRLVMTTTLLALCVMAFVFNITVLKSLIHWPLLLSIGGVVVLLSIISQTLRYKDISSNHLFIIFLMDIACWSALIAASGGSINPGISYLLVLLIMAGLALPWKQAFVLLAITALFYAWIMRIHPSGINHRILMGWHLWGMWILFVINALLMLFVITVLSKALRQKDQAIASYREETVRNEQLVAIGVMAANIAHEIGTPLSTMAIVLEDAELEDKVLLLSQIERCKHALHRLKNSSQFNREEAVASSELLLRWQHECQLIHPQANMVISDNVNECIFIKPLLDQAMLSMLNNAVEACKQQVKLSFYEQNSQYIFDIEHDGKPIALDMLQQLGRQVVASTKQGLGLGYYLANASIESIGGRVTMSNQPSSVLTRVEIPKVLLVKADEK